MFYLFVSDSYQRLRNHAKGTYSFLLYDIGSEVEWQLYNPKLRGIEK